MKVGTDGILLGAWADVSDCQYILDMGTGTGLIALMLAQAVELDPLATQQAQENFQASPWHNRLYLTHQDVQTYCQQTAHQFDLIVANPPYFAQGVECRNNERALARYVQQSHLDWLIQPHFIASSRLMSLQRQGKIHNGYYSRLAESIYHR